MVFLRLTVKVYPRDPVPPAPQSSFSLRSLLRDRDNGAGSASATGSEGGGGSNGISGKPVNFLLVVEQPEEVTLGALAGMIQEKWTKLRPDAGFLEIKKLLDDAHESDDLDADMTVADVWVDIGKGLRDGLDQRGAVRVIQKPAPHAPVRYASVVQDWDAAAEDYERLKRVKLEAQEQHLRSIPAIQEEEDEEEEEGDEDRPLDRRRLEKRRSSISTGTHPRTPPRNTSANGQLHKDISLPSVERDEEPVSIPQWGRKFSVLEEDSQNRPESAIAGTPQPRVLLGSQELGSSPAPKRPPSAQAKTASLENGFKSTADTGLSVPDSTGPSGRASRGSGSESPLGTRKPPPQLQPAIETIQLDPIVEAQDDGDVLMSDSGDTSPISSVSDDPLDLAPSTNGVSLIVDDGPAPLHHGGSDNQNTGPQGRKRKKSHEETVANKEPRLDSILGPEGQRKFSRGSLPNPGPVDGATELTNGSPSALRRRDRAPSFSSTGRRSSLEERSADVSKPGLGLGITKSPLGKKPVHVDLSQDAPTEVGVTNIRKTLFATPVFASSQLGAAHPQDVTPSKFVTPTTESCKRLHSALRKDSSTDRPSERRSVSFADDEDVVITGSTSKKKTISRSVPKDQPTPTSQPKEAARRSSNVGSMVFPPGVDASLLEKYQKEAEEKQKKKDEERMAYERKIKAAEGNGSDSEYLRLLRQALQTWIETDKCEKSGDKKTKARGKQLRQLLEEQQKKLQEYEAKMTKRPKVSQSDKSTTLASSNDSKMKDKKDEKDKRSKSNKTDGHKDVSPSAGSEPMKESAGGKKKNTAVGDANRGTPTAKSPTAPPASEASASKKATIPASQQPNAAATPPAPASAPVAPKSPADRSTPNALATKTASTTVASGNAIPSSSEPRLPPVGTIRPASVSSTTVGPRKQASPVIGMTKEDAVELSESDDDEEEEEEEQKGKAESESESEASSDPESEEVYSEQDDSDDDDYDIPQTKSRVRSKADLLQKMTRASAGAAAAAPASDPAPAFTRTPTKSPMGPSLSRPFNHSQPAAGSGPGSSQPVRETLKTLRAMIVQKQSGQTSSSDLVKPAVKSPKVRKHTFDGPFSDDDDDDEEDEEEEDEDEDEDEDDDRKTKAEPQRSTIAASNNGKGPSTANSDSSDSESDSDSDSDSDTNSSQGDILPSGDAAMLRKAMFRR